MEQFGPLPPEDAYLTALDKISLNITSVSLLSENLDKDTAGAVDGRNSGVESSHKPSAMMGCPAVRLILMTVVDEHLSSSAASLIKALSTIKTPLHGYESPLPPSPCPRYNGIGPPSSTLGGTITKPMDQISSTFKQGMKSQGSGTLDAALLVVCTDVKAFEACQEKLPVAGHSCFKGSHVKTEETTSQRERRDALSFAKVRYILNALSLGFGVLYLDPEIGGSIRSDPVPSLLASTGGAATFVIASDAPTSSCHENDSRVLAAALQAEEEAGGRGEAAAGRGSMIGSTHHLLSAERSKSNALSYESTKEAGLGDADSAGSVHHEGKTAECAHPNHTSNDGFGTEVTDSSHEEGESIVGPCNSGNPHSTLDADLVRGAAALMTGAAEELAFLQRNLLKSSRGSERGLGVAEAQAPESAVPSVLLIRPTSGAVRCVFDWMVSMWNSRRGQDSDGPSHQKTVTRGEVSRSSTRKSGATGLLVDTGGAQTLFSSRFETLHYQSVVPECAAAFRAGIQSVTTGAFQCLPSKG
ncbi:hypothetical protein CEUSTIGMA_g1171.t1 [Chlamydomonas eustigma]|uniref:Uncharacterized protein n=1 Tax=Chlamydomonas eustigma TaxID=1157962 RepID=A0A250WSB0_9CHLO|nr:hypothetical protein CEUSTIGMA_g1171.t1 [Chlamydomonas eustigma]|eukprot:GAX73718.1 hypothetical protein CEUSTIGMA_g1171.t1 [Chlamydomonas eustigma]